MFCQELVVLTMKTPQYHFQDYVQITLKSLLIKKDQPGLSSNVYRVSSQIITQFYFTNIFINC